MAERKFEGRVAIVTGGSTGIGLDVAKALAKQGAKLVLVGRTLATLELAAAEILEVGGVVEILVGDTGKEETNKAMVELALEKFGAVHIAFLNAGVVTAVTLLQITEEQLDQLVSTNVKGLVFGLKHVIPAMRETAGGKGSIITNSSATSGRVTGLAGGAFGAQAATKAMGAKLMEYAAVEAAPDVRVNAIAPGIVETPIWTPLGGKEMVAGTAAATQLLNTVAKPENITPTVLLLAGDDGAFITGAEFRVDGGFAQKAP